jgi:small subunit ribosomal protein S16
MLTIRLTRKGKKNQPFFRVVLVDKRESSKSGKSIEDLGYVNPLTKKRSFNAERIKYWLSKGAKPSETIHNWLVTEKIIEDKKIHVSKLSKKKQAEIDKAKADAVAEEKAKVEAEEKAKVDAEEAKKAEEEAKVVAEEKPVEEPKVKEASAENKPEEPKEEKPVEEKKEEVPAKEAKAE